jgi:hypothetical protein
MSSNRREKTVIVADHVFALSGAWEADGRLKLVVCDIDCALAEPNDEIARRFKNALAHRLKELRRSSA